MANPFPFVSGAVLTAAELNGIGEAVTFTPTWTNVTVGNGTQTFEYVRVQNLIHIRGRLTFGSTTSLSGVPQMNFPITADDTPTTNVLGLCTAEDAGVATYPCVAYQLSGGQFGIYTLNSAGTYLTMVGISATVPFTFGTNDVLSVNFVYKAA